MARWFTFAAALAVASSAPAVGGRPELPADRDLHAVLDVHNQLRARFGVRPLRWNPLIAANAERYAHALAATGVPRHSPRAGRENERENFVVGPRSRATAAQLAQIWVAQGRLFRPGTFPNVCVGGPSSCFHFTQMVWPMTSEVGCGFVRGRFEALVCLYSPPGNKDGVRVGLLPSRGQSR